MDNNQGKHIIVSGLVQGVFFRAFTKEQAKKYNVTGWTRNLSNGSVEVLAFGLSLDLDRFVNILQQGSKASRVDGVEITAVDYDASYSDFRIISSKQ